MIATKVSRDVARRLEGTLVDLDEAWDGKSSEYNLTANVPVAIRYIHRYFREFLRLGLFSMILPEKESLVRDALSRLDRAWRDNLDGKDHPPSTPDDEWGGDKWGGYVNLEDEDIRRLHLTFVDLKAACIKKGGWPL